MNQKIYITGHRHPDSDSIVSAIAYTYLKKQLGYKAIACRLGDVNLETNYLLKRFNFEKPLLLEDARAIVKEIEIDKPFSITKDTSIKEVIELMTNKKRESFGVVDENQKLCGVVSKGDLGFVGLGDTAVGIELLKQTNVESIAKAINGRIIYNDHQINFDGKVSIPAINSNGLENYKVDKRIVILGNDEKMQIEAIKANAAIIILVWSNSVSEKVIELAKEYHCAIIISGHGTLNTSRYLYFAPKVELIMNTDLVYFNENEFVEDVETKMLKSRFRSYPVVDNNNHLTGYISRFHLLDYNRKKIIMVDHNEYAQSVKGIEKAQLLEVIDHHRIYDIRTNYPITFRNEIIGSTTSIITSMFFENNIEIPKNLAGLMLSAIISDTLNFKSPTTTEKDKLLAEQLSIISGENIENLANDLFSAGSNISEKSLDELINQDIKKFDIAKYKVRVSQIIVSSFNQIMQDDDEIEKTLDNYVGKHQCDLIVFAITSVLENSTKFYGGGKIKDCITMVFKDSEGKHTPQKEIVSRKNQIIPALTKALNRY